jgi:patatin-like phospholipase/acyl hydrolase
MALQEKLSASNSPKRILSLDGGGIRGIFTLGILKKIESLLRVEKNNPNLLLGDYYDLIGGTSTGAIIASGLAIGKTVDEIIELYLELGKKIFGDGRKHRLLKRDWSGVRAIFNENYSSENLENYLKSVFGDIKINDKVRIKCGLAINTKRADTNSLWTMTNSPGIYNVANAHLTLWELCRASAAAPYYFKPKKLQLRKRNGDPFFGTFIDGVLFP